MDLALSRQRVPRYSNQANRPVQTYTAVRSNAHWRNRSTIRIRVSNLPPGVTTYEIHRRFEQYGNIVHILIPETGQGGRSSIAEINFDPVPTVDFWSRRRITFPHHGTDTTINVELARFQKEQQLIPSPVNEKITYPKRLEVLGTRLDFGFLSAPTTLTIMRSCNEDSSASKLLLDLKRKEIEVHFKFVQNGTSCSKARSFRFRIALDEKFNIWQLAPHSFVIQLSKAPPYTKKLSESLAGSHSPEARSWSEEDMWARQADICFQTSTYRQLESMPVTLQKQLNTINIARWTTFLFHASIEPENQEALSTFLNALDDWNVPLQIDPDFKVNHARDNLEQECWSAINGGGENTMPSAFLHDLSRIDLEFSVRYQLEVCLSHGWITEYAITAEFLEKLAQWPPRKARQALVYVATNAKHLYNPMTLFTDVQYSKPLRVKRLPDNCIEVYSATVTATGLLFHTPSVEISNRIVRKYKSKAHRFLRVRFEDDDYRGHTRLFPSSNNKMITIFKRVKRVLNNGIVLGGVKYEFLAWGSSQLREHGVWFVAPTADMTADRIRKDMGDFEETIVAKKAARMGQCFSTTQPVHLPRLPAVTSKTVIPDIKRGKYIFTDGVGKISELAARLVANQLEIKGPVPSLFQFRLGGCKGVLAVTNDLPGIDVQIRKSQHKFNSLSNDLEIIRWAQFWQPFLNRQIILCLSHLGISTSTFLRMQDEAVHALNKAMTDDTAALKALRTNVDPNQMTLNLCELVEAGFLGTKEPFTVSLLHLWRAWSLKYLKEKAKIPVSQGAFVLGTVDETASLRGHTKDCPSGDRHSIEKDPSFLDKLPEIFVQITDVATGKTKVIEGLCILARNPSLYPGDIRVVMARNVPALSHMVDVVVMPQDGERDLPSMCSGGDLDGDDYIVIWDPELIPQRWNVEPFHYEPPPPKTAVGEIKVKDLIDFFHDYLRYDSLGRIATAHLAAADFLDDGLDSNICQELAELHSQAVDYPKTGVPAIMGRKLERDRWPHFMEKTSKRTYHSHKVLGKLYDAVQKVQFKPCYDFEFDARILGSYDPPGDLIERIRVVKTDYDNSLRRILSQHRIGTEFELWSTFVLHHSKASRDYKFHEEVGAMSKVLKDEFHDALAEIAGGKSFENLAPIAVTAYKLTKIELDLAKVNAASLMPSADDVETPMPFISFPWVLQDTLIKVAIRADKPRKNTATIVPEITQEIDSGQDNIVVRFNVKEKIIGSPAACSRDAETHTALPCETELPSEDLAKLSIYMQEGPDLYGTDLGSSGTESSNVNDSALATPAADQQVFESCLVKNSKQYQESTSLVPPSTQNHSVENLVDIDDFTTEELQDEPLLPRQVSKTDHSVDSAPVLVDNRTGRSFSDVHEKDQSHQNPKDKQWTEFLDSQEATSPVKERKASDKTLVCQLWRTGQCQNSEESCQYTHHETGKSGAWPLTCWYWKNGMGCSRGEQCHFAHWDTARCDIPAYHQTRTPARRDHRGSPSKRRRRQLLSPVVPTTESDSDLDPVPQTHRFSKRSPTKRMALTEFENESTSESDRAPFNRPALSPHQADTCERKDAMSLRRPDILDAEVDETAHHIEQDGSEPAPESSPKTQVSLLDQIDDISTSPSPPKISQDQFVSLHTTAIDTQGPKQEFSQSRPRKLSATATAFMPKPHEPAQPSLLANSVDVTSTHVPQRSDAIQNEITNTAIPPWTSIGKSGHVVNLYHNSGQVQSSRVVLNDPADHGSDSDGYEVDEIFD